MIFRCLFLLLISFFLTTPGFAQIQVNLQLKWKHQFQFAGYYAAIAKGFYQNRGIQTNLLPRDIKKNPVKSLTDQSADFAISDSTVIIHYAKGDDVVILASIFQHNPNVLVTLKQSGITHPSQLKGKKVMPLKMRMMRQS